MVSSAMQISRAMAASWRGDLYMRPELHNQPNPRKAGMILTMSDKSATYSEKTAIAYAAFRSKTSLTDACAWMSRNNPTIPRAKVKP